MNRLSKDTRLLDVIDQWPGDVSAFVVHRDAEDCRTMGEGQTIQEELREKV